MFSLSGKTALVTGASGGIGGAIAKALAAQGARVALSGTRLEALEALKAEIGGDHPITPCNLADSAAVDALVGQAETALGGRLDILVANAGVTRDGLLLRMKDSDWETVLKVNLEAYFRLSRAALRNMMRNRWGRIIGITSVVGVTGNPGQANYAASKAGMIGFTKALAAEVASRNVTANCIAPGFIASAMTDVLADAQKTALLTKIPAGRLGSGADVAAAAVYLASEEAAYVTGQTLHVNGGMAMI
jgi:3-oxoacyl-[acyl-carrier protein] reductase